MNRFVFFMCAFFSIIAISFTGCDTDDAINPTPLNPCRIEVSLTEYNFGALDIGDSADVALIIANRGEAALMITEITLEDTAFTARIAGDSRLLLANDSLTVRIIFHPPVAGVCEGRLLIRFDDDERPEVTVTLRGVGLRPPDTLPEPWLIVANYAAGAGNLSVLGLNSHSLRAGLAGLGNNPNDIVRDGNFLFVVNSVSQDLNVLEINDDFSITAVEVVDLGREINASPEFAAMDEDHLLYITNMNLNNVSVYDTRRREMLETIPVGLSPMDILIFDGKAYVCNSGFRMSDYGYDPGAVSIIDLDDRSTVTVNVPLNPQYLAQDYNGQIHVICTGNYADVEGNIAVIDPSSDEVDRLIPIGGKPAQAAFTTDNIGYVAAYGEWGEENPGLVFRYDADTGEVLNGPDNPIFVGNGAARIASGDEGSVYIACFGADRVDKLVGYETVESFQVGDGPSPLLILTP